MDEGLKELRNAVRSAPERPDLHNVLGTQLADAGRLGETVEQFERAVGLDPDSQDARRNLEQAKALQTR